MEANGDVWGSMEIVNSPVAMELRQTKFVFQRTSEQTFWWGNRKSVSHIESQ